MGSYSGIGEPESISGQHILDDFFVAQYVVEELAILLPVVPSCFYEGFLCNLERDPHIKIIIIIAHKRRGFKNNLIKHSNILVLEPKTYELSRLPLALHLYDTL